MEREVRLALPPTSSHRIEVPTPSECDARIAFANSSGNGDLRAELVWEIADGKETAWTGAIVTGPRWQEISVTRSRRPAQFLNVRLDGPAAASARMSVPLFICDVAPSGKPAPNIVVISLDTLRADRVGAFGGPANLTPRLDALAKRGAVFTNAFAHYPNTLASHASLFTGRLPTETGVLVPATVSTIRPDLPLLAEAFASQGYATAAYTENGYVSALFGFGRGFDIFVDGGVEANFATFGGTAEITFARALKWLESRPGAPFFLFVHTYQVHTPYKPKPETLAKIGPAGGSPYVGPFANEYDGNIAFAFNRRQAKLTDADLTQIGRLYDAEVHDLDAVVAPLLDTLSSVAAREPTVIVVLSDHGDELGEHGFVGHGSNLHRETMQVPLTVIAPERVRAGTRIDDPVGLIDIAPTLVELAGLPDDLMRPRGRSIVPMLDGTASPGAASPPILSELKDSLAACAIDSEAPPLSGCSYDGIAVRDSTYTYIEAAAVGTVELYDTRRDPAEHNNIATENPEIVARYAKIAAEYRQSRASSATGAVGVDIDSDTRDRLRTLGYVE